MIITENAGSSTIKGAELELMYKPLPELLLQLSYAYSDAYFDEYVQPGGADLSGNRLPASPKHSYWLSSEYNHFLKNNWEISVRADYSWRDEQVYQPDGFFGQDGYGLLNLAVWLTDPEDTLTIRAFCGNCDDTQYTTNITQLTPVAGWQSSGHRRHYGLSAKYNF
jgi:iron complex outermembrane receptor protein